MYCDLFLAKSCHHVLYFGEIEFIIFLVSNSYLISIFYFVLIGFVILCQLNPSSLMLQLNQELEQDDLWSFHHQVGSPIVNSPPGRVTLNVPFIVHTHFAIIYLPFSTKFSISNYCSICHR